MKIMKINMKIIIWWQESYKILTQIWKDSCGIVLASPSGSQTCRFESDFKCCLAYKWVSLWVYGFLLKNNNIFHQIFLTEISLLKKKKSICKRNHDWNVALSNTKLYEFHEFSPFSLTKISKTLACFINYPLWIHLSKNVKLSLLIHKGQQFQWKNLLIIEQEFFQKICLKTNHGKT